ncbi:MAG: diaminobutyrate acetyltransferase [Gammaproteobacteria bacterium]
MKSFQENNSSQERPRQKLTIRNPKPTDAISVHNLIRASAFVDDNSPYLYLLVCSHFAKTSAIAERNGETVGVISGYIPPEQPDTLFVWQVAVDPMMRRQGLARTMLKSMLLGEACKNVQFIDTTVTADNSASRRLFTSFANKLDCPLNESVMFDRKEHFLNLHDSEHLLRIGPFSIAPLANEELNNPTKELETS